MKKCPFCAELIQDEAIVCRYCGRDLPSGDLPSGNQPAVSKSPPLVTKFKALGKGTQTAIYVGLGFLFIYCLLALSIAKQTQVANHIEATEQTFNSQLTEASDTLDQQATSTALAHAIQATATAAARTRYISDPFEATLQLEHEPSIGSLKHTLDVVDTDCSDVWFRDAMIEARFFNPYSTSQGKWDYGFMIRDQVGSKSDEIRVIITSENKWYVKFGLEDWDQASKGELSNLNLGPDESNLIKFIAQGDTGYLYINDSFVSSMDIGYDVLEGDFCVAGGIIKSYKIEGYQTKFEDFSVWSLTTP